MLIRKLPGFESGSSFSQLPRRAVVQLKRVRLSWWQAAVVLVLLVILANSGAQLIWALLPAEKSSQSLKATIDTQRRDSATSALANVNIDKLVQLNLFGVAGQVAAVETVQIPLPEDDVEAENTRLALKLTGVLSSSDPRQARAMIAHNNKQKSYNVGDKLPGGRQVTLDRVLAQRVILNNAGRYESLWLFEEPGSDALLVQTSGKKSASGNRVKTQRKSVSQPANKRVSNRNLPKEMPTLESLAEVIRVTPHSRGIQVKPVRDLAQFEQLGLKSGDVVTAVNGSEVSLDPDAMRALYLEVLQAQNASFQILRNGKTVDIDVALDKLNSANNNKELK